MNLEQFLDDRFETRYGEDVIWFTATIIHHVYKDKYCFTSYEDDMWVNKLDTSIPREEVMTSLLNDIRTHLINELLLYNRSRQNKYISIIVDKLETSQSFMKSVMRELRELCFERMKI